MLEALIIIGIVISVVYVIFILYVGFSLAGVIILDRFKEWKKSRKKD